MSRTGCRVKALRFDSRLQQSIIDLLDDTDPVVRSALLDVFARNGRTAARFLQQIADGNNRILSFYARAYLAELRFSDPVAEFRGFIRSLNYELETGLFLMSRIVHRDLDVGVISGQLDELAARCRELIIEPATAREKCRVLNRVIFFDFGFHAEGAAPADPDCDFVDQVLVTKAGTPASLCVLYLLVARRVGLELEPVLLPGHFVAGCFIDGEPFFIDAAEQGTLRTAVTMNMLLRSRHITATAARLAPSPVREVLCRCCREMAAHYDGAGDRARAQLFTDFATELDG